MSEQTALYRHWDARNQLLYVGISLKPFQRLEQHECGSHWAGNIAAVTVEYFATRQEAERAERAAISDEHPVHNIVYAANDNLAGERKLRREAAPKDRMPLRQLEELILYSIDPHGQQIDGATFGEIVSGVQDYDRNRYSKRLVPAPEYVASTVASLCLDERIIVSNGRAYLPVVGNYKFAGRSDDGTSFFPAERESMAA